jgi:hypothetical protein
VFSRRVPCDVPITRLEGSYLGIVSECDLETSTMRRPSPTYYNLIGAVTGTLNTVMNLMFIGPCIIVIVEE